MGKNQDETSKPAADRKSGKFHYNPVNMAGKKAGESTEDERGEQREQPHSRDTTK